MSEPVKLKMYRITLKCQGLPYDEGAQAAKNIEKEFSVRTWHVDVHCRWDDTSLFVTAWNDFDDTGEALQNEFSDLVSACLRTPFEGEIELIEVLSMS